MDKTADLDRMTEPVILGGIAQAKPPETGVYWNKYYASRSAPALPSQFAVFVAGEMGGTGTIIEFGCGSGRDTIFFARHGLRVLGIDGSSAAIEICSARKKQEGLAEASFVCADVGAPEMLVQAQQWLGEGDDFLVLYARFFLHAITEEDESSLLHAAAQLLEGRDGYFAVEFRTIRDRQQEKVTPHHYRRFITPVDLLNKAHAFGFRTLYFVEGTGFAKYRQDDAHVARCIFTRG